MRKFFELEARVQLDEPYGRYPEGTVGTVAHVKNGFNDNLVTVHVDGGGKFTAYAKRLSPVRAARQYLLHGRPIRKGDRVFNIERKRWVHIGDEGMAAAKCSTWSEAEDVASNSHKYAWDEPPQVDLRTVPPPLFFVDGLPVRKGSIMFDKASEKAVVIVGNEYYQYVEAQFPQTGNIRRVDKGHLTYDFPNTPSAPEKVLQQRTRWFNIYENDAGRTSFHTYRSEEEAKKYALPGCLGQGYFRYQFVGPQVPQ